ncbi:MAG: SDR family oxidoreductase [Sulfuricaulis sp.]|nr:SDR family oxidoreductase [Sulfuricaulis sp.]
MSQRLKDRVAVVTGAARGIGRAIAERFASEGARVACLDVSAGRIEQAVAEMQAAGHNVRGYVVDVSNRAAVRAVFERIEVDFGAPIAALVNNAAWIRYQAPQDIDEETLDRMLGVGLKALVWTLQAALPQLERSGHGAVVNICSTAAVRATADSMAYCAVKGGVAALTRAAAVDFGRRGIRVNAIAPAFVPTAAALANFNGAAVTRRTESTPLGRLAQPEEIAAVATFLVSDDSTFINGELIIADGGRANAAL